MRLTQKPPIVVQLCTSSAANLEEAAELLGALVRADSHRRPDLARRLRELEHRGDELTRQILSALKATSSTPLDRQDVRLLAERLDDVIDALEEAGDLIVLYRLRQIPAGVEAQVQLLQRAARITTEAMAHLGSASGLSDYRDLIDEIDHHADTLHRELVHGLRVEPENLDRTADLVTAIKIKDVVEHLQNAADAFERVADVVRSIAGRSC